MIGTTLGDIRDHIESLATPTGQYYLVCGRTRDRPVPTDGLQFKSRTSARAAVRATEQYRAALRQYDPQVPYYDVIVCERRPDARQSTSTRSESDGTRATEDGFGTDATGERPLAPTTAGARTGSVVEFCHTVAGVVFETIADSEHSDLENCIMETYFEIAETVDHPNELCFRLLESIAMDLDAALDPREQAALLAAAAAELPTAPPDDSVSGDPLERALAALQSSGLLETYRIERCEIDLDSSDRSWVLTLEEYALGEGAERIVTLPIVVELFRRLATRSLAIRNVERLDGAARASWRLTVGTRTTGQTRSLVCVQEDPYR
jgi:hypothetical protein